MEARPQRNLSFDPVGIFFDEISGTYPFCCKSEGEEEGAHPSGGKGDGTRTYIATQCLFPASTDSVNDNYVQGIARGWGDIYDYYLPDQYIEVSGVTDGEYILETSGDSEQRLREKSELNNCTSIRIQLQGMASATPTVRSLGPGPACSAPQP